MEIAALHILRARYLRVGSEGSSPGFLATSLPPLSILLPLPHLSLPASSFLPPCFLISSPLSPPSCLRALSPPSSLSSSFLCLYCPLNSPPHVLNKFYSILYLHVAQEEGVPQHGPTEAPRFPIPHHTSTRTYPPLSFYERHISMCYNNDHR